MQMGDHCPILDNGEGTCDRVPNVAGFQRRIRTPLNNNRGNNRRRGRGNNRPQGGGNQLNRIDSRARGNAPQLLEKFKKLAQDAAMNGDRVQAEYYYQFADHYFRVIADGQAQKDDPRARRDGQRDQEGFEEDGDFDRGPRRFEDRSEPREDRSEPREDTAEEQVEREVPAPSFEPPENPFVRDNRPPRDRNRNRDERPARRPRRDAREAGDAPVDGAAGPSIDVAVLPPAINPADTPVAKDSGADDVVPEAPKPRRRTRKTKAGGDETLENVG